jgi:D-amino-acid dehydrogenase
MAKITHANSSKSTYVIGAGIVGACTAIQLLNAGHPVVLIEKDAPGSGASSGNAGSIGTASIPPYGMPGLYKKIPKLLFDPLFPLVLRRENIINSLNWFRKLISASELARVNKIADARASILAHAEPAYTEMLTPLRLQNLIQKTGLIHTYQCNKSFLNSDYAISLRKDRGINLVTLSGHELRDIEPMISDSVESGIFYPDIGTCFNPGRMNALLVESFIERGGKYLKEEVKDFELVSDRCLNIITDSGKYRCEDIVLTAGVWSKEMAKKLGCDVYLEAERGYHIMVNQPISPLKTPLVSADYHVAITPMEAEIRMSTMSEFSSISASEIHQRAYGIMKQAGNVVRNLDVQPNSRWVGPRPSTPDSLPIIGRSTNYKNVIFAFGHGHLGLTLASITGKLVSELCRGVKTSVDITAFSPYRNFTGDHL